MQPTPCPIERATVKALHRLGRSHLPKGPYTVQPIIASCGYRTLWYVVKGSKRIRAYGHSETAVAAANTLNEEHTGGQA